MLDSVRPVQVVTNAHVRHPYRGLDEDALAGMELSRESIDYFDQHFPNGRHAFIRSKNLFDHGRFRCDSREVGDQVWDFYRRE